MKIHCLSSFEIRKNENVYINLRKEKIKNMKTQICLYSPSYSAHKDFFVSMILEVFIPLFNDINLNTYKRRTPCFLSYILAFLEEIKVMTLRVKSKFIESQIYFG